MMIEQIENENGGEKKWHQQRCHYGVNAVSDEKAIQGPKTGKRLHTGMTIKHGGLYRQPCKA